MQKCKIFYSLDYRIRRQETKQFNLSNYLKSFKIKNIKKYLPNGDLYDMIIIAAEEVDRQSMQFRDQH